MRHAVGVYAQADMLLDTDFLIDLSGNRSQLRKLAACGFLEHYPDQPCFISRVGWSEFAEGAITREPVAAALSGFVCLEITEETAWLASRIARQLSRTGQHIGDNGVWQAAIALDHGLPLVTGNRRHFQRVQGLTVLSHR
jgi:predicted nucleic acid-binding protein